MFKKVLIANRGEIALRVIRACNELGIATVAVHSEADANSLHVRFADEDVCIGPGLAKDSYLDPKRIISVAEVTNADAIHPGYGFLAENADFAEICQACNLVFIGPTPQQIRLMGDKLAAKNTMAKAGVRVIPGSDGPVNTLEEALEVAEEIDYPLMIKAAAGGGGRGLRCAMDPSDLKSMFDTARAEAQAAFGNPAVYLEKFLPNPRHVEIQILGDHHGNVIHFGERDCTIQRRHQKLLEESPCPILPERRRHQMAEAAVRGAKNIKYRGAGTVEFLYDPTGHFYFMEMNTRIQVEHPVTEEVADIDLVKEQIKVAAGEKLSLRQGDVKLSGHALECRINAEDPERDFMPCPGELSAFHIPGGHGIRVDTHAYVKYVIPPFYDSLVAKVIAHGKTREEAIIRMRRALEEFTIEGIKTTIPFHLKVLHHERFLAGQYDTAFVEELQRELGVERVTAVSEPAAPVPEGVQASA